MTPESYCQQLKLELESTQTYYDSSLAAFGDDEPELAESWAKRAPNAT